MKDSEILKFVRSNQPISSKQLVRILRVLDGNKRTDKMIQSQIENLERNKLILCSLDICVLTRLGLEYVYGDSLYE